MAIDLKKTLNAEQLAAVTAPDGPLLVLAAAGTGKTRTLVYRVAYMVDRGISPDRILLLTFTNRAAKEMLERARGLVGIETGGIWAGTFHHMCNRILRRHAPVIGYTTDYVIMDSEDSKTLMSACIREFGHKAKDFPKRDVLLSVISSAANTEVPIEDIVKHRFEYSDTDQGAILEVLEKYLARKRESGAMDFDDLLVNCLHLFNSHEGIRGRYQEQFQHVLVDEYQDTNTIQSQLIDTIAERQKNIMVVGDDFQSIYSWRGADFMNIMTFSERYPSAGVYKLETNYRSTPQILGVANACIAGNPDQFQKTLRATRGAGERPVVFRLRDGDAQARQVIEQIHLLRREGCDLSSIAVLYRAHYHAMELQIALTREQIPYVITSGVRFFEQAHIKDVCSLLKVLEGKHDMMGFSRLLQLLPGIGVKTVERIWKKLDNCFDATDETARARLIDLLPPAARTQWQAVNEILASYRTDNLFEDVGEVIHRFLKAFYEQYAVNSFENFDRRIDDIRELILFSAKAESVSVFLADIALLTNIDTEYEKNQHEHDDALVLSTVHQAKGLEWDTVMILWATEGMFPSSKAIEESVEAEAEERRLFYVAVTRAKNNLFVMVPEIRRTRDGGVYYCEPSRFVEEMPREMIRTVRCSNY